MAKLEEIEGIGEVYLGKLKAAGVDTIDALLEAGAAPKGRDDLEQKTGISHKLILEWINHADLIRVDGVGVEYADLLEEAGVDTVVELATRNPDRLHTKLMEVNEAKKLVRRLPNVAQVTAWVECAKGLPRIITYS